MRSVGRREKKSFLAMTSQPPEALPLLFAGHVVRRSLTELGAVERLSFLPDRLMMIQHVGRRGMFIGRRARPGSLTAKLFPNPTDHSPPLSSGSATRQSLRPGSTPIGQRAPMRAHLVADIRWRNVDRMCHFGRLLSQWSQRIAKICFGAVSKPQQEYRHGAVSNNQRFRPAQPLWQPGSPCPRVRSRSAPRVFAAHACDRDNRA